MTVWDDLEGALGEYSEGLVPDTRGWGIPSDHVQGILIVLIARALLDLNAKLDAADVDTNPGV